MNRVVRRALGMRPKPPPKYRILVMMATNMPSALDEALLRPGRIDRIYRVGYPSKPGRVRTYEGYLDKVQNELTAEQVDKIATMTPYATGASIKDMVNEALITAIRDGRDVITWQDLLAAKRLKALGPPEDVEYIERERHATAIHEACHAVVAYRTIRHMEIDLATIEKGAYYLGMVASIPPEDQFTTWRNEYESDILASLASLAGERMFFDNDSSSGVSADLDHATTIATQMEGFFGMGQTVSSLSTGQRLQTGAPGGRGKGNQEDVAAMARRLLADRIEDNLSDLLERAVELLRENEKWVLALAHALETHKTINGEDVTAIFDGQRGPVVDGRVYADESFIDRLREYHEAAKLAHHEHSRPQIPLPVAAPVWVDSVVTANGYGTTGNGSASGATEETVEGTGTGAPNGTADGSSNGSYGAPPYEPPLYGPPDGSQGGQA
jgi:ATP-dependent Zn protease